MKNLERKLDLIIELLTAEDAETKKQIVARLDKMSTDPVEGKVNGDDVLDYEIGEALRDIGVPCSVHGYYDLTVALKLLVEHPEYINSITKRLYYDVAKIRGCDRTAPRVERAMRHAIEIAWDRCDLDVLAKYFGNTVSGMKGKPTNSEFLSQMAIHIRRRLKNA